MKHRTITKKFRRLAILFSEQVEWYQSVLCSLRKQHMALIQKHNDLTSRFILIAGCMSKLVSPLTAAKLSSGLSQPTTISITPDFAKQIMDIANLHSITPYVNHAEVCPRCGFTAWFVEDDAKKCAVCEERSERMQAQHKNREYEMAAHDLALIVVGKKIRLRSTERERIKKIFGGQVESHPAFKSLEME